MYQAQHEQHIQDLKKMITGHESLDARFEFTHRIFQAYLYYNADSAIVYAPLYESVGISQCLTDRKFSFITCFSVRRKAEFR